MSNLQSTIPTLKVQCQDKILLAVLDTGSEITTITSDLQKELSLKTHPTNLKILGLSNTEVAHSTKYTTLSLNNIMNKHSIVIKAYIIPTILNTNALKYDVLLGISDILRILPQIKLNENYASFQTTLGDAIVQKSTQNNTKFTLYNEVDIDYNLKNFWECDNLGIHNIENNTEQFFKETTTRDIYGRFVVRLPFKTETKNISNTQDIAFKRLRQIQKRMQADKKFAEQYTNAINEYIKTGHLIPLTKQQQQTQGYYIPHHAIIKEERITTKVRIVYDASATGDTGISLNNSLQIGPTIQPSLHKHLFRLRQSPIIVLADITKMYRQVNIHEQDHTWQRILWSESISTPPKHYALTTVTFGVSASPFLAIRSLLETSNYTNDSNLKNAILNSFYVDDYIGTANTIQEATETSTKLWKHLHTFGFEIVKWSSNHDTVLQHIPSSAHLPQQSITNIAASTTKILGVKWNKQNDTLMYNINLPVLDNITKRKILATTSQIYDPLGILAPLTSSIKQNFQKLWLQNEPWDRTLNTKWEHWWNKLILNANQTISIPRLLPSGPFHLIIFCDASNTAYASVAYMKSLNNQQMYILESKTKVAPLTKTTIPRLELTAATQAVTLAESLVKTLNNTPEQIIIYSDSQIVLHWIKNHASTFKQYVANRIKRIQSTNLSITWKHINGNMNPADLATREYKQSMLNNTSIWWQPSEPMHEQIDTDSHCLTSDMETKVVRLQTATITNDFVHKLLHQYIDPIKTINIITLLYKFCNFEHVIANRNAASLVWSFIQSTLTSNQIHSLHAVNDNNVWKLGGRLQNNQIITNSQKHPIILPKSEFTNALIQRYHRNNMHATGFLLQTIIRKEFWIIGGTRQIRKATKTCVHCIRYNAKQQISPQAKLTVERVNPSYPFTNTGVDFAGPINYCLWRQAGKPRTAKTWIVIFICYSTTAVYLDLVPDLTLESYLNTQARFTSIHGVPSKMFSDNGTTFIAAKNINNANNSNNTTENWHLIPPYSPNFGGLWEAGVKSCKYFLKREAHAKLLTYHELQTLLFRIANMLNSRPLSYGAVDDPQEFEIMTANHFLRQRTQIHSDPFTDTPSSLNLQQNLKHLRDLEQGFWTTWHSSYLQSYLTYNSTDVSKHYNIQIGDVVLLIQPNCKPSSWELAYVENVKLSDDNIVRSATIRRNNGKITSRATTQLVKLFSTTASNDNRYGYGGEC